MNLVQPVIMAGGKGTRLWPLSRPERPKQFLPLVTDRAVVADVAASISLRPDARSPIVFTGEEYVKIAQAMLAGQTIGIMVLEPIGRSTAFVAATASLLVAQKSPGAMVVLLAADSSFSDSMAFHAALDRAVAIAKKGQLVLLGVKPTWASTQFGYIECDRGGQVSMFREKPDADSAAHYVADGRHLWNSGNFVFRADAMLEELQRLAPEILAGAKRALEAARTDGNSLHLDAKETERVPSISLDHAVMEKTKRAAVVRVDCDWLDVGSWGAIWILCKSSQSEFIRMLHEFAGGELGGEEVERPWGSYNVLLRGAGFQVKTIEVQPGQAISLQYHHKRAEHWIVTRGLPRITVGNDVRSYGVGETVFVDVKAVHRIENPALNPAAILEIQIGDYLGEDDIVRLEDRYNRNSG